MQSLKLALRHAMDEIAKHEISLKKGTDFDVLQIRKYSVKQTGDESGWQEHSLTLHELFQHERLRPYLSTVYVETIARMVIHASVVVDGKEGPAIVIMRVK